MVQLRAPVSEEAVIYGFFRRMHGYGLDLERTQTEAGTQLVIKLLHYNYPVQFLRSLIEQATDETICPLSKCSLRSQRELVEPTTTRRPRATYPGRQACPQLQPLLQVWAGNEPAQRNPFGSCADDVLSLAFLPTLVYSLYPSTFPSYVLCWKPEPLSELH